MENKLIPVTLLTGYLGSGKTTLLNKILKNANGRKIAVIVNDIGEVNIDAELVEKTGIVNSKNDSLVPLQNGCICCNLKTDLLEQINQLVETNKFDHIVIEASGICEPVPIAQTITMLTDASVEYNMPKIVKLDAIVSVVDAKRMVNEFNCGDDLVTKDIDEEDIENLVIQQIEFCDVIILNKISGISELENNKLKAIIKKLQPHAKIIETDYCEVDMNEIIDTNLFDFERAASSSGWIEALENPEEMDESGESEEYGISSFVYYRRKPFDTLHFEDYFNNLPRNIIRTKGIVYFNVDTTMSYLFESAGSDKQMSEAGLWLADAPEEERATILMEEPEILNDWDPEYGDRMIKMVFIGSHMDKEKIISELDKI